MCGRTILYIAVTAYFVYTSVLTKSRFVHKNVIISSPALQLATRCGCVGGYTHSHITVVKSACTAELRWYTDNICSSIIQHCITQLLKFSRVSLLIL